jgi:hypothetical protein
MFFLLHLSTVICVMIRNKKNQNPETMKNQPIPHPIAPGNVAAYDFTLSRKQLYLTCQAVTVAVSRNRSIIHVNPLMCSDSDKAHGLIAFVNNEYMLPEYAYSLGYGYQHENNFDRRRGWYPMTQLTNAHQSRLLNYHSGINVDVTSADDNFLIGLEIEKESDIILTHNKSARAVLAQSGWKLERDGSLDSNIGYEMVSPVLPLHNESVINASLKPVENLINGNASSRCGGHINISRRGLSTIQTAKLFEHSINLLYGMYPSRVRNHYCGAKTWTDIMHSGGNKYQSLALKNNRIELRIFPAVNNLEQLKWRVELMRILVSPRSYHSFHTDAEIGIINLIKNAVRPNTSLGKHLRKIYTPAKLKSMLTRTVVAARTYGNYNNYTLEHAMAIVNTL